MYPLVAVNRVATIRGAPIDIEGAATDIEGAATGGVASVGGLSLSREGVHPPAAHAP
jgi:hypothetical protein